MVNRLINNSINYNFSVLNKAYEKNHKRDLPNIFVKIKDWFINNYFFPKGLKTELLYNAEHLAVGQWAGGFSWRTLPPFQQELKKIMKPEQRPFYKSIKFAHNFSKIEQRNYRKIHLLSKLILRKVSQLQDHEFITFQIHKKTDKGTHALMVEVERQAAGKLLVRVHNTGFGVNVYHYRRFEKKHHQFQLVHEFENVEEVLFNLNINRILNSSEFVEDFYEKTLPKLGVPSVKKSEVPTYWNKGQLGGSCSASSILSVARIHLPKDQLKTLKFNVRIAWLYRFYEKMANSYQTNDMRLIALDTLRILERSYLKKEQELPEDLQKMRSLLKGAQAVPKLQGCFSDNLKLAFRELKKKNHHKARVYIEALYQKKYESVSPENMQLLKKYIPRFTKMTRFLGSDSKKVSEATFENIDLSAGLCNLIYKQLLNQKEDEKLCKTVWSDYYRLQLHYLQLKTYKYLANSPWSTTLQTGWIENPSLFSRLNDKVDAYLKNYYPLTFNTSLP